jgi:hypothetical protein
LALYKYEVEHGLGVHDKAASGTRVRWLHGQTLTHPLLAIKVLVSAPSALTEEQAVDGRRFRGPPPEMAALDRTP